MIKINIISFPFKDEQIFKIKDIYFKKTMKNPEQDCEFCCFNGNKDICKSIKIKCHNEFEYVNANDIDISNVISLPLVPKQIIKIEKDFYEIVESSSFCDDCAFIDNPLEFCKKLEIPCTNLIFKKIPLNEYEKMFLEESD